MATKLEKYAEELVDDVMEGKVGINEAIDDLNSKLEVFDRVKVHRDRLMSARRALLGVGNKTTANAGTRVTSDEVALWLSENGPASPAAMAEGIGTSEAVIRGHMSRGKDRFEKLASGEWRTIDHEREEDDGEDE
jgi:hypothetical protein